ncbi:MAG: hypothetical protein AB1705_28460 [Verrucomicrobiota bacterium]
MKIFSSLGRVYTITVTCTNEYGNQTSATVDVFVPVSTKGGGKNR